MQGKKVFLIRHAESLYNIVESDPLTAHDPSLIDCSITERGREQSRKLGQTLKTDPSIPLFDVFLISPLKRARETFELLDFNVKYEICHFLREYKQATCDFLPGEDVIFETPSDIKKRSLELFTYILSRPEMVIGVVCHSDLIWYLTSQLPKDEKDGDSIDKHDNNGLTTNDNDDNDDDDDEVFGIYLDNADYYLLE